MWWFKKTKKNKASDSDDFWKSDFSDCVTADFLPDYSVCQCNASSSCRYVTHYAGTVLCRHPEHRRFIPEGSKRFNPHGRLMQE